MKVSAAGLRDFLSLLPHYDRLPLEARRALASIERPSQSFTSYILGGSLPLLIDAGFILPPAPNGRCAVPPLRQEFIRVLRAFCGHSIFQKPGQPTFDVYMAEHFTIAEREALRGYESAAYTDRNWVLFRHVTASDWVETFLKARNEDWEEPYLRPRTEGVFSDKKVLSTTQNLIRFIIKHSGRAALRDIPMMPGLDLLSAALHAGLRYALLFAALDPDTLDPVVGVWPGIVEDKVTPAVPPPQSVTPAETFDPLFLLEDMTALLVACAAEPLRLRANDSQLFAKTVRELSDTFRPLPRWVEEGFNMEAETRVYTTVSYVRTFGLVEEKGFPPPHMAIGPQGREWLALPTGDRLRVLVDGILNREQAVAAFRDFEGAQINIAGSGLYVSTRLQSPPDITEAVMQPFRALQGDGFFPIQEIVAFASNPLLDVFKKDKGAYFAVNSGYLNHPDQDQLQKLWSEAIRGFVRTRLVPLGGVRVGRSKDGLSIAVTPVGRYFLGQAKQWRWSVSTDSQIIVQPNFEVTFLGEAPAAEAELARFAERRGRQMGALFQITRKSIFAAAAADMTADMVFAILDRVCSREVPANVRREIQGWFAQCRKVSFESVMLIRCPDRETALRIVGMAKGNAAPLSDTVLEYKDPGKQRPALIKKLRDMGVIVSVEEKVAPKAKPPAPRRRRWGRW